VLWPAFRVEILSEQQFEILRIVLALAGGGAMVPGFLEVSVKASTNLALRAGGVCGIIFWSPVHWRPSHEGAVIQRTEGPGPPIQSGSGNTTIYNGPVK